MIVFGSGDLERLRGAVRSLAGAIPRVSRTWAWESEMVVWGLASVIIGEALVGTNQLGTTIVGRGDGFGALPVAGRCGRCGGVLVPTT